MRNSERKIGSSSSSCVNMARRLILVISIISCKKCKGKRVVSEKKRQEITIEKGMADRQRIVLNGEGDQAVGVDSAILLKPTSVLILA